MRNAQDIDVLDHGRFRGLRWAAPIVVIVALLDQLTKRWALNRLIPGSCDVPDACIDLVAGARFRLVFNTGAALDRGEGFGPVLAVLVSIITIALLVAAARRTDRLGPALLGLVAGGAIGNLIDRVTRAEDGILSGPVVDFIDLGWWPVFNVADAAVVGGVLGFVALAWFQPDTDHDPDPEPDSEPDRGGDRHEVNTGERSDQTVADRVAGSSSPSEQRSSAPDHGG